MTEQDPRGAAAPIIGFLTARSGSACYDWTGDDPTRLVDVLDSQDFLELASFLEERWDVVITDPEITAANFATVAALVALVNRKLAEAA